mmetsp:Transcript_71313/g.87479  ORF Transcript_71313/g.87479 Transcript_71313/m.87479 type:complete len:319 (+) Transcript_71313:651-1607(+)
MFATSAVTKVTRDREDALAHILGITWLAESNDIRQPRVRFLIVVGEAQATTHSDVETQQLVILNDGNEACAVRKKVHIIAGWNGHCHLELAWQVSEAVQGFLLHWCRSHDLDFLSHFIALHQEDLMVCSRSWQAMVMDIVGVVQNLTVQLLAHNIRAGCAQHIAANIAACGHCVHASLVHGSHGVLDVPLEDSMHLPSLTGSDFQGSIGKILANVIHSYPLLSRAKATWQADTNHEAEGILNSHLLPFLTQISVILLVGTMGLDQLGVLEWDLASGDVIQGFLHASSELLGLNLDLFIGLYRTIITTSSCIGLVHTKA